MNQEVKMRAKTYGYFDVGEHAWMLLDKVRVKGFIKAISNTVQKGDIVVDVGAGSGILSLAAAKAGAKKVYAVEQSSISGLTEEIVKKNGFSEVIEVVKSNAREVDFEQKPNVIISEMIGNFGFDEDILSLLKVVATKCTPNVKIIPNSFELIAAPILDRGLKSEFNYLKTIDGFDFSPLLVKLLSKPVHHRVYKDEVQGKPVLLKRFDIKKSEIPSELEANFVFDSEVEVNAVGVWVKMFLDENTEISTGPYSEQTHWLNLKFPMHKVLKCNPETGMKMKLYPFLLGRTNWKWEIVHNEEEYFHESWKSLVGNNKNDFLSALGLKRQKSDLDKNNDNLKILASAFGIDLSEFSMEKLVDNLLENRKGFYESRSDAYVHLAALLDSLGILK